MGLDVEVVSAAVVVVVVVDSVVVGAVVVVVDVAVVGGAAVVNGLRPITKLLLTHAPDPEVGTGASRRYGASGSALAPCRHVNVLLYAV